ncbi:hypothetical protein ACJRO7_020283 [Eucalyptus globulus]|uniref:Uncharacterized protein n=1 Tax=Eucalyptus globulus TaxID=34317 RepID=A0ABD3KP11_EUCGL
MADQRLGPNPSFKDVKEAIDKQRDLISNTINWTLNYTNLYFVFQGMVFSSIMSSKKISCKLKWIPITLSLLVSIYNFLAVCVNMKMLLKFYEELEDYWPMLDDLRNSLANAQGQELQENPANANPANAQGQEPRYAHRTPHRTFRRQVVCFSTLLLLLAITAIMLWGCFQVECVSTAVVTEN